MLKILFSRILQVGFGHYPNLRVKRSPDYQSPMQQISILRDTRYIDVDVRARSTGHSRCNSEDQFIHVPEFEESIFRNNTFPMLLVGSSNNSRSDSCQGWDEAEKQSNETSEDLCREVRCIETEESSVKGTQVFNCSLPEENGGFPSLVTIMNGERTNHGTISRTNQGTISRLENGHRRLVTSPYRENGESKSSHLKEDQESVSSSFFEEGIKSNRDSMSFPIRVEQALESPKCKDNKKPVPLPLKEEKKLVCVHSSNAPPERLSSPCDLNGDSSCNRNLKLCKNSSCKASIITDRYSPCLEESDRTDVKRSSGNGSTFHVESAVNVELEVTKRKPLTDEEVKDADGACNARTNEMDELQYEPGVKECPVSTLCRLRKKLFIFL